MSLDLTHENCHTCAWLGREAERTATRLGRTHWTSETQDEDGTTHVAYYEKEGTS